MGSTALTSDRGGHTSSGDIRPRILLVDDEDLILRTWMRQFEHAGIESWVAHNAREAAETLVRMNGNFDAVVCDLHMTNGSGIDLYRFIEAEYPRLKHLVVIVTGSTALSQREKDFLRTAMNPVMYKPFEFEPLVNLVRDWAARRRTGSRKVLGGFRLR